MELYEVGGRLYNKLDEAVEIEPTFVFPMMKSSEVAKSRATGNSRMLVTQTSLKSETDNLESLAPKTWKYLSSHAAPLDARRSSIYRNRPRFCVFGVGNYTFAPYKVAISGFYKRLRFELVAPHEGRPVVFDDTVYFLPCHSLEKAELVRDLLNSSPARQFFSAFIFWDAKRPITVDILRRLDLRKLAEHLGQLPEYERLMFAPDCSGQRQLF
jgi:hypothetical protein